MSAEDVKRAKKSLVIAMDYMRARISQFEMLSMTSQIVNELFYPSKEAQDEAEQ